MSTLAGSPFMSKQEGNGLVRGKDIKGAVVVLSKTQPQQLSLFQTFLPDDERYSNTIDLYDAIPKYFPRKRLKKERVEGMFLPMLKREFEYKGERFGLDHGVGHSLLLLYDTKAPNCQKSKD